VRGNIKEDNTSNTPATATATRLVKLLSLLRLRRNPKKSGTFQDQLFWGPSPLIVIHLNFEMHFKRHEEISTIKMYDLFIYRIRLNIWI